MFTTKTLLSDVPDRNSRHVYLGDEYDHIKIAVINPDREIWDAHYDEILRAVEALVRGIEVKRSAALGEKGE